MFTKRLTEEETRSLSGASQQPLKSFSGAAVGCVMADVPPLRVSYADVPPLLCFCQVQTCRRCFWHMQTYHRCLCHAQTVLHSTCLHAAVWLILREAVLPQPAITLGFWSSRYSAER